jgi:hypothetical protein
MGQRSFGQPCKQRWDLCTIPSDLTTPKKKQKKSTRLPNVILLLFFSDITQILFPVHKSVSEGWGTWRVIKHGVGVGLRNAACGLGRWRWVCTREMCASHLKSEGWFVGWVCGLVHRACFFQVEGPGIYPQHYILTQANYQLLGNLRLEDCMFQASLGSLKRPCSEIAWKRWWSWDNSMVDHLSRMCGALVSIPVLTDC